MHLHFLDKTSPLVLWEIFSLAQCLEVTANVCFSDSISLPALSAIPPSDGHSFSLHMFLLHTSVMFLDSRSDLGLSLRKEILNISIQTIRCRLHGLTCLKSMLLHVSCV